MDSEERIERRIVTVLFADLAGFTSLSEQFDAEDIAQIQDGYFAGVRETIGRYGGQLEKFIGDAAMAVFGVPRSRDDDAERAVRAGLALIGGIQQLGARLGLEEDALRLRVGVNTGEVVVAAAGTDEGRITGDTVNTAARLQTAAPPGGVLIGEATALALAEIAELGPVTPLELKGKAEATRARLVEGFRMEPSRESAMGALRAPTLGRDWEVGQLAEAHRRAAQGSAERWLIVAPPGVGKSRLLDEFAGRIGDDPGSGRVWRSRARPGAVSPFEPVSALMRTALAAPGDSPRTPADVLRAALLELGSDEPRATVVTQACMSVIAPQAGVAREGGAPGEDRDALFGAWLEGLDALAAGRTQTWLIEDIHWAGGDLLAFLDQAGTNRPASGGRLVVATARPSLLETHADWARSVPEAGRHGIHLSTLAATDAEALVEALVGNALPRSLVERVASRSDGNCLFIEELLRTWVSVGTLQPDGDSWTLSMPADEIPLPTNVQSIYAAQLDDLPPEARRLARRASVAGRRFPVGALRPLGAISGADMGPTSGPGPRADAEADAGLAPLIRRELVSGPVAEPVTGDAYAFRHALLRDAGYASLARAERARLHVRLARWLEQASGDRSADVAEQIAGHYASAVESSSALATRIDEGLDRAAAQRLAARWYERAGQATLALSAHDAARQLFRRAIDMTPEDSWLEKARRWQLLADATAFAADMDEGATAYRTAMDLYRQVMGTVVPAREASEISVGSEDIQRGQAVVESDISHARAGLARATAELSNVMYQQLEFAAARDLAAGVMDELGDVDPASRARLLIARAHGSIGAVGPTSAAEAELVQALELARVANDPLVELRARHALTVLRSESGQDDQAAWAEIADQASQLGQWPLAVTASINGAGALIDDKAAQVYAPIELARRMAEAHGLTDDVAWTNYIEAEAAFASGDWPRAIAAGLRAIDIGEENAYLRVTVRTLHVLIPIAAVRGDRRILERAANWYRRLEGRFEFPDSPYARVIRPAQDLELAQFGLHDPFVPEVEPRIASFADEPGGPSWSAALDRVFRAWLESGEIDGAGRALAAMTSALPSVKRPTSLALGTYELLRGRLAGASGDTAAAAQAAQVSLEHFRVSSAPWWMAKAIRLLERSRAADGQLISEAREIERGLGAAGPTA